VAAVKIEQFWELITYRGIYICKITRTAKVLNESSDGNM